MKQAIVKLCALWCLLGTALPCVAVRLTLRQCLTLACMRSHHVALAGLAADIAAADYQQAVAGKYPPLSLQGGYSRLKASDPFSISLPGGETVEISPEIKNTYQLALQTDVPLFTGGALSSSIQGAAHGAAAARQQTRQTRVDLCLRVIYAYWDLYLARRSLVVIQENITHLLAVQRDVRNAFDQGMLLRSEVLDVAVRLAEVRVLAADTAHRVRTTQARLNALLGWPLEQEIVQLSLPLRQPVDRPLGDLYAMAVSQRPDVVRLQELYQQARYGLRAARANRYPQCSLKARAAYERPNYRNIPIRDEFQGHWEVGVLFAWTLWDWGVTGAQYSQARIRVKQLEHRQEQLKEDIHLELTTLVLEAEDVRMGIAAARQGTEAAREKWQLMRRRFAAGVALCSDILDAEADLLQARLEVLRKRVRLCLVQARLQRALGEEYAACD